MTNAGAPTAIPIPTSSCPGANPQEGAGRLINCYVEPLGVQGKGAIAPLVWRRSPGLSLFGTASHSGYRGGMQVGGFSYEAWGGVAATVDSSGNVADIGVFPGSSPISIAHNLVQPVPDVVAVDPNVGAYILHTQTLVNASATATIGGTVTTGDVVTLTFINDQLELLQPISYTVAGGDTLTTIATHLTSAINANASLSGTAIGMAATSSGAVITITQPGSIANQTFMQSAVSGAATETVSFAPTTGYLAGGGGTAGITWSGTPLPYNGLGAMPQPNSVAFEDGYFFFTTGQGQVFASDLNALTMNALSFVTISSRSDVTLLRGIAYSGLMFFFTTASCEIWQDTAQPPPGFPYSRAVVLDTGLIQSNAIAGFETGFAALLWVDQDYGVYYMLPSSLAPPQKVSTPDLERLIEAQIKAGATLEAGCYFVGAEKFWTLSSPAWTWEFNIRTAQWNERWSLQTSGIYGRWRGRFGHPAFSKFILGDVQSGNLLVVDDQNYSEVGVPQLFRIESGPVAAFPGYLRVARADFLFDMGVGVLGQAEPVCAVSWSMDGGFTFGNPLIRSLAPQGRGKRYRVSVKNCGLSPALGVRWRLDVTDAVYTGFMGGTQSSDPRAVGA